MQRPTTRGGARGSSKSLGSDHPDNAAPAPGQDVRSKPRAAKRGLTQLCGGRFAIVPADVCEDHDLGVGAFRLFAVLCGRADARGEAKISLRTFAAELKVTARAVRKWRSELERGGYVEQVNGGGAAVARFRINRTPGDRQLARLANDATLRAKGRNHSSTPRVEPQFRQEQEKQEPPYVPPSAQSWEELVDAVVARQRNNARPSGQRRLLLPLPGGSHSAATTRGAQRKLGDLERRRAASGRLFGPGGAWWELDPDGRLAALLHDGQCTVHDKAVAYEAQRRGSGLAYYAGAVARSSAGRFTKDDILSGRAARKAA